MNFKSYLEAIPAETAKQLIPKDIDKDRLKEWFNGQSRIYIPLKVKLNLSVIKKNIIKDIEDFAQNFDYSIIDFDKGLIKVNNDSNDILQIEDVLKKHEFNSDYIAYFIYKRLIEGKDLMAVISKHPYDILGKHTDRFWSGSLDLLNNLAPMKFGIKREVYRKEIKDGNKEDLISELDTTLISYLTFSDDKYLKYPLCYISILPFLNKHGKLYYIMKDTKDVGALIHFYKPAATVIYNKFFEATEKWLESKQGRVPEGKYGLNPFINTNNSSTYQNMTHVIHKEILPEWFQDPSIKHRLKKVEAVLSNEEKIVKCEGGIWNDGIFKNGTMDKVTWENGTFENGKFTNSVWKNGKWKGGVFEKSVWENGEFIDGLMNFSTWFDGNVVDGSFLKVIWDNGTFMQGSMIDCTWKNGTFSGDEFESGKWIDGTFRGHHFYKSKWLNGLFVGSKFRSSTFKNGTFHGKYFQDSKFLNGTFSSGEFVGSKWFDGIWEDNEDTIWNRSAIYSFKFDELIISEVNPIIFKEMEKYYDDYIEFKEFIDSTEDNIMEKYKKLKVKNEF